MKIKARNIEWQKKVKAKFQAPEVEGRLILLFRSVH